MAMDLQKVKQILENVVSKVQQLDHIVTITENSFYKDENIDVKFTTTQKNAMSSKILSLKTDIIKLLMEIEE